jgi:hypothetical protein
MTIAEWGENLGVRGLLVFAPAIIVVFYFIVIALGTMISKVLGKTPVNPVAWYD